LIYKKNSDAILASGKTNSNDEVYIQADKNNNLIAMSKDNTQLENIYGELVGISKISHNRYTEMCFEYEKHSNEKIDYEYIMVQTAKKNPFFVKKIQDLVWCEIDDESHLNRALESILPKINTN
jgi:2-aminoethylphosphonate-pyruvate transaminase